MGNAQRDIFHAKLLRYFPRFTPQFQRRASARFPHHFQIHPSHSTPPARSQRLHRRLFCRNPPRVPFVLVLKLLAVFSFLRGINPSQEHFPIALDRPLDTLHFRNVHAHSNDQDASSAPVFCVAADSDYTVRVVAPTKTLTPKRKARKRSSAEQTFLSASSSRSSSDWIERKVRGIQILQVPALAKLPWLVHGFSTRPGGVSLLNGEKVLNLGFTEWDSKESVLENRRRFQSALGASDLKLISLKQIHSDVIHLFDALPTETCQGLPAVAGDASVTSRPGLLLGIQTADCVPILLVDPKKRAIAAVHAGWRGTLQRIVVKAIGQMQMHFGSKPTDLLAAIGPSIGCCYEVGTEV